MKTVTTFKDFGRIAEVLSLDIYINKKAKKKLAISPAVKLTFICCKLPDECGHILTVRNRTVAIK